MPWGRNLLTFFPRTGGFSSLSPPSFCWGGGGILRQNSAVYFTFYYQGRRLSVARTCCRGWWPCSGSPTCPAQTSRQSASTVAASSPRGTAHSTAEGFLFEPVRDLCQIPTEDVGEDILSHLQVNHVPGPSQTGKGGVFPEAANKFLRDGLTGRPAKVRAQCSVEGDYQTKHGILIFTSCDDLESMERPHCEKTCCK